MQSAPVDHKDEPGEYRRQVRAAVFDRVGAQGSPIASPDTLTGEWSVSFVGVPGEERHQAFIYLLKSDGSAVIEIGGHTPSIENRWQLNDDGSVSVFVWVAAMPEYGVPDPTHEEERMHAAASPNGCFVLWSGDGSLVKLLSPLPKDGDSVSD